MKRFFALLLLLSLALSLASCAERAPAQESPAPSAAQNEPAAQPTADEPQPSDGEPVFLVAEPEYPVMVQYSEENWSEWRDQRQTRREQYAFDPGALDGFLSAALPRLLSGADGGNLACSPLNIYLALAMAAEISGGESRAQLLRLLDADSLETLESRVDTLWNANYRDDGMVKSILASSLWMRDDTPCLPGTVQMLCDVFRASSYRGDMSDPRYTQALRDWLNTQTGGQLADAAENVSLDPNTMLELLTTVYFRAKWIDQFDASDTAPAVFHAPDGDIECDFMNMEYGDFFACRGERFLAVQQSLDGSGGMWFLLPDEGVTPEELLSDPGAIAFLCSGGTEHAEWYYGKVSLPKLDVASNLELSDILKALGVTDVFDPARADLSALFEDAQGVALTEVQHAARVTMDEEGVTATAFTAMGLGAGGPALEMDFTLDRPFLFKISSEDNAPLFVGVVNHP